MLGWMSSLRALPKVRRAHPRDRSCGCSAPPRSSHTLKLSRPILARAEITERLMRPPVVVPSDPAPHSAAGFDEAREAVLPDALFLQATKKALDHPVLLRRVGGDEFLTESVVLTRGPKAPTLENESVVAAQQRRITVRAQGPEAVDARRLERPLGLLRATAASKLVTDELAIGAVDHRREVHPAVGTTVDVRDIHGPPLVAPTRAAAPAPDPGPRRCLALMDEPALEPERAVDGFAVDWQTFVEPEQRSESAVAKGRMQQDQSLQACSQDLIHDGPVPSLCPLAHRRARYAQPVTDPTLGNARHDLLQSPDVVGSVGRPFAASRRMSTSRRSSPTFCLTFLICSSLRASSSFGRARSAFSAAKRKRSCQSSISATVSPCLRAASATDLSPRTMLSTKATRRFAVHRCTSSGTSAIAIHPSAATWPRSSGWRQPGGERCPGRLDAAVLKGRPSGWRERGARHGRTIGNLSFAVETTASRPPSCPRRYWLLLLRMRRRWTSSGGACNSRPCRLNVASTRPRTSALRSNWRPRSFRRRTRTFLYLRSPLLPLMRRVFASCTSVMSSDKTAWSRNDRSDPSMSDASTIRAEQFVAVSDRQATLTLTFRDPFLATLLMARHTAPLGSHFPRPSQAPIVQLSSGKHGSPRDMNVGLVGHSL